MFLRPNTGLGHSSMILMIEAQIEHITAAIRALDLAGAATIEVERRVHDAYNRTVDRQLATTVWELGGCTNFYRDVNGRNAAIDPDWMWKFRRAAPVGGRTHTASSRRPLTRPSRPPPCR